MSSYTAPVSPTSQGRNPFGDLKGEIFGPFAAAVYRLGVNENATYFPTFLFARHLAPAHTQMSVCGIIYYNPVAKSDQLRLHRRRLSLKVEQCTLGAPHLRQTVSFLAPQLRRARGVIQKAACIYLGRAACLCARISPNSITFALSEFLIWLTLTQTHVGKRKQKSG